MVMVLSAGVALGGNRVSLTEEFAVVSFVGFAAIGAHVEKVGFMASLTRDDVHGAMGEPLLVTGYSELYSAGDQYYPVSYTHLRAHET